MPGAFLYDNVVQGATLASAQADVPSMPLSNLQDAQPRRRVRLSGSAAAILVDMGSDKMFDCAALISTTLGAGATVRARVGPASALVEAVPVVDLDFMTGALDPRVTFTRASAAWYFNSAGNLTQAATNQPRFDYDPATLQARGLLIEGSSSNIALHSRDFTQAAWSKTNITAALNVTGIDGAANSASRLTATAGNGTALQTITSASATHVSSFFARRITGTGTVEITQDNGASWTAITLTAAWQRFNVPAATVANPVIGFRLGTNGDVIAVDVAQCEVRPAPSSPIITTSAAVTRANEPASITTLSPWFNPTEGTMFVECLAIDAAQTANPFIITSGLSTNEYRFRFSGSTFGAVIQDSVGGVTFSYTPPTSGNIIYKGALAYAANNSAAAVNGVGSGTDTTVTLPTGITVARIGVGSGGVANFMNGWIRRLAYYPTRLTNAQLVALSGTGSSLVPAEVTGDTGTIAAEAEDANQGNVIMTLPAPAVGRYLRIDIENPTAAFTDIGVLAAGALWRVLRGTAYGIREGRVMLDRRDRNPFTGAEFPVPAIANPRLAAFTLPSLSVAEARSQHRALLAALGAAGDALWIAELNDGQAERNRRAIWGAVNAPGEDAVISRDNLPLSSRAFRIQERL